MLKIVVKQNNSNKNKLMKQTGRNQKKEARYLNKIFSKKLIHVLTTHLTKILAKHLSKLLTKHLEEPAWKEPTL